MMVDLDDAMDEPTVPLRFYTEALDEIWHLRRALAYEARGLEAHTEYARFPKSRRPIAAEQVKRMREAAGGEVLKAYAAVSPKSLRHQYMRANEGKETLTRAEWEAEKWW